MSTQITKKILLTAIKEKCIDCIGIEEDASCDASSGCSLFPFFMGCETLSDVISITDIISIPTKKEEPKPKRKRRTKAQMEAAKNPVIPPVKVRDEQEEVLPW
ncbi:hypothetical protein M0R04_09310 [Candidatus Dojkabacteria bacterium]|jgi:hypothetical protein|nr:hypothetical protein [Candidatus Dojkabacteria bacterium]